MFFYRNRLLKPRLFSLKSSEQMKSYLIENIEKYPGRALDYSRFHDQVDLYITVPQTTLSRIHLLHGAMPYKIITELSRHFIPKSIRFEVKSLSITDDKHATLTALHDNSGYPSFHESKGLSQDGHVSSYLEYQFRVQILNESKRMENTKFLPITLHLPGFHLIQSSNEETNRPSLLPSPHSSTPSTTQNADVIAEAIFIYQIKKSSLLITKHHIVLTYPSFTTLSLSSA